MPATDRGDFQTPNELARAVVQAVMARGVRPASVLEPSAGSGSLLVEAAVRFGCTHATGLEIDEAHLHEARARMAATGWRGSLVLHQTDVFHSDLQSVMRGLPDPVLVLGNPPWVTNSALGALGSSNRPARHNFQQLRGLDALTGKSNFDLAEWVALRALEALVARGCGALALLCKYRTARRLLEHVARTRAPIDRVAIFAVNALQHFGASVEACLLSLEVASSVAGCERAEWFESLESSRPARVLLFAGGRVVLDEDAWRRGLHLLSDPPTRWRSGIKHDCAAVMELRGMGDKLVNGLGEEVTVEDHCRHPLLKGMDLIRGTEHPVRWMIVPQTATGQDTAGLQTSAPAAWEYLCSHHERLDRRASSVYRGRPPFSIFGVGPYSFAPWKIAVPALHRKLVLRIVAPEQGRAVVLDDTCCFLPCRDELHARVLQGLLDSDACRSWMDSFVFWGDKRPLTCEVLGRVSPAALARSVGTRVGHQLIDAGLPAAGVHAEIEAMAEAC